MKLDRTLRQDEMCLQPFERYGMRLYCGRRKQTNGYCDYHQPRQDVERALEARIQALEQRLINKGI